MSQVMVTIDNREIKAEKGKTILEVCREYGIHIPTLCYHPRLRIVGACRVCVVEIAGARTLVTACTGLVDRDGMVITTGSERVLEARRMIVELLLASGDHNCLYCEANGHCELQDLVYELKIEQPRFPIDSPQWLLDDSNPMILRDLNKCILCGRCVRGCNEVQVNQVIDFGYRGSRAKIVTAYDKDYAASNCVFCGECVQLCPTGALVEKKALFGGRPWRTGVVRDDSAARIVKRYARRVGLDPAAYAGHSLRSGFLTSAAETGASVWKLSEVSRHMSLDTLRGYVRRVDLFKEHAGAAFL
jgi:NADH dehydrogenase/NADH:ubiquinone oxidoreductase subunit G